MMKGYSSVPEARFVADIGENEGLMKKGYNSASEARFVAAISENEGLQRCVGGKFCSNCQRQRDLDCCFP
ncbi:hypothetical protein HYC85_020653 [Camellia sinensis]|uniref:Uncharacterized protein n=1 Tax=Camellia sinensis TaxID=4442 RepID=A0A7J7GSW5_CAMSI|nr:hypothetical protein HYC85_020653 [Camellia sinensis]